MFSSGAGQGGVDGSPKYMRKSQLQKKKLKEKDMIRIFMMLFILKNMKILIYINNMLILKEK